MRDLVRRLSVTSVDEVAEIVRAVGALTLGADRVGTWTLDAGVARGIGSDIEVVALDDESHPIAHVIRSPSARWLQPKVAVAGERVPAACVLPLIVEDRVIGAIAFTFTNDHLLHVEERELVFEMAVKIAVHAARAIDRVCFFGGRPPRVRSWPSGTGPIATVPTARRILIVGEQVEAAPFARALEQLGHEAVVVHSGAAAVRVAEDWPADVAFVDVDMVASDATGVASQLQGEHATLVALTRHRARVPGFTAHVLKPFELGTVVDLLDSFDRN